MKKQWANHPPKNMIMQMNAFIKNLQTPIAIVGMGKSGEAARRLLIQAGITPNSIVTFDAKLISANFQDPTILMAQVQPRTLIVSPGVPLATPWIALARQQGVRITSELSLACSFLTTEKLIGVTGSVGKSTTVSLLGAGLQAFSSSSFVGGNLGTPFADYAADIVEEKRPPADWVVLELSSYQLENCENLNLNYGAITYFSPNHLERYSDLEHYYKTKWTLLNHTQSSVFLNKNGGDLVSYSQTHPALSSQIPLRIVSKHDPELASLNLTKALLIGEHNQDNLALASALALAAGWPHSAIEAMKSFRGLAHRLENLGEHKGIRFINDSKATAMESVLIATAAAHSTLSSGGTLHLLLGGRDKNLPWENLSTLTGFSPISFTFFGECREIAQKKSRLPGSAFTQLHEALDALKAQARPGDTILLSPGGTSLDEFKSFEDRGGFFKNAATSW
ncbi:MAG: UDP-N-acetylmuramoyl-L-alanine--D-glutamate ligase [Bdellovibrio sp.]